MIAPNLFTRTGGRRGGEFEGKTDYGGMVQPRRFDTRRRLSVRKYIRCRDAIHFIRYDENGCNLLANVRPNSASYKCYLLDPVSHMNASVLALRVWSSRADTRLFMQLLQLSSRLKQEFLKGVYMTTRQKVVSFMKAWGVSIYKRSLIVTVL